MTTDTLFHFGDLTAEVLPTIQRLERLAAGCETLGAFIQRSTSRLRAVVSKSPACRKSTQFASILDLAVEASEQEFPSPAVSAALSCFAQLGDVIVALEVPGPVILGICTGLVAALTVACCRNIIEVLAVADDAVELAYVIGAEAGRRSGSIDTQKGSWSTLVTGVDHDQVQDTLDAFNKGLLSNHRAYISATGPSSVTISGPPAYTDALFADNLLKGSRRVSLPIFAAFHAEHLESIPFERVFSNVNDSLLKRTLQHTLISPHTGRRFQGSTFSTVFKESLQDIFQAPIEFKAYTEGLSKLLSQQSTLFSFGPVNSARAITLALSPFGIELAAGSFSEEQNLNTRAIAIVGMAARLPGSETLKEFWKVLEEGRDLHEKIRPDRFDVKTHCDPTGKTRNASLTPYGVFIDRPGYFDTRLFNMSPREAAQTDPQQRLMLLTTYEALEMAGYSPNATPSTNTRRIGSFIGQTSDDWREVNASQNVDTYFITGGIRAFGPGRLNYHFGWEGPSYSVDTACSSSAASIQLACSALLARECDMAVGGGANFLTASDLFAGLSRGSFLSKTGGCKTFDHDADGYVRADAVGVVVLKRLEDAMADRDNILAVVRSAVTNHSAEAVSITHPHAQTQERLFRTALSRAGVEPQDIDYAELHGTGTQAGDATETRSVTNVLARGRGSDNPLYIGTVKPNLGHGEAASGVTSLIKAIMVMRENMIPPHVGIKGRINQKLPPLAELNTHIAFNKTPFLPRANRKRRILINNFDAAGGNTSLVIEDPPVPITEGSDSRSHQVVVISGKTPYSAMENSKRLLDFIRRNPSARLEDIAYTTTARRMHHPLRSSYAVSSVEALAQNLERTIANGHWSKSTAPSAVFLFTGQGSQYLGMASELFGTPGTFRSTLQDLDRISMSHGFGSFLPLIESNSPTPNPLHTQLAIVSIELALAAWWKSIGVMPSAVLGHSLGEFAALCTAGVMSVSDCLYLVGKRASLMVEKCSPGTHSMLAIQASAEKSERLIEEARVSGCEVACVNGPASTVVSGAVDEISRLGMVCSSQGVKSTVLEVQFAFHSAQMDAILDEFEAAANMVKFAAPEIPVASTVLGTVMSEAIDSEYLRRQTRGRVQFLGALQSLQSNQRQTMWIETGPNPTCLGLVRSVFGDEQLLLPSLKRKESDWKTLSTSVARAYAAGIDIDWKEFHRPFERSLRLLEVPHYAFDLKNYWIQYEGDWAIRKGEAPAKAASESTLTSSLHRIESESNTASEIRVTFAADAKEPKLNKALRGHLVNGAGLCPSSVYADMAFTAAKYIRNRASPGNVSMDVRDMEVHKPLLIEPGETGQVILVTATWSKSSDKVIVSFGSRKGQEVQDHANCTVYYGNGDSWKTEWARTSYLVKSRFDHLVQASATGQTHKILRPMVYKLFSALVDYDTRYQGLREVYMDSSQFEAAAFVKFNTTEADGTFTYSPYWIDSLAHLSGFVLNGADNTPADSVYISHGWKSLKIVGELSAEKQYQSYVRMRETKTRGVMSGDVYFFEDGEVVALCEDLKFQRIRRDILNLIMPRTMTTTAAETITKTPPRRVVAPRRIPSRPVEAPFHGVLDLIASEVGVDVSELSDDAVFADLGVDSLLSISIAAKLSEQWSQEIPATLFMDCPTVGDLRAHFADNTAGVSSAECTEDESDVFSGCSSPETPASRVSQTPRSPNPGDDLIKKIIASEVGLDMDELDEDTPLADLGVDSLLSLSITAAIKAQTGRILPSSFLVENPTLAAVRSSLGGPRSPAPQQLARALAQVQAKPTALAAEAVLLQGEPKAGVPALFLLPDGSGSASSYVGLPRLCLPGAVYGLNSPFLQDPEAFTVPLQDVASAYVAEIRRVQPHGPYHLAGWSIGGTYAYEVASQLIQRHGQTVESLVLIDAPCPKSLPPLPTETISLLQKIGAFDGLKVNKRATAIRDGVLAHFAGSVNALKRYRPAAMPARLAAGIKSVTALWARQGVWETVGEDAKARFGAEDVRNAAADWIMDPRSDFGPGGWEALLPGREIKCKVVAGDHFSIMRKPGVVELGKQLADAVSFTGF
ncbi:acyl transferase acyl hydrolase lysophospholipase [Echria macrotheca]|uniref:Acyl transferase acyl hydrolase lysophospholipase n=1 Tax=Echria macrotheca TaxID=438768 RepID=A0AAJ0BNQ1_9PEZI|nr:acyl transferase acyl hydrolase lysophospholipase [Echria macrotheca]